MAKREKEEKTNVMRLLEQKKIAYKTHCYANSEAVAGMDVATFLGQDPAQVFKTLVTRGASGGYYVFMVPVHGELNLKKAAKSVGEKSIEMIHSKELLPLTGYIHGGCSPVGMKKQFPTVLDASAQSYDTIFFSAGKIGYQVECTLIDLKKIVPYKLEDILDRSEKIQFQLNAHMDYV